MEMIIEFKWKLEDHEMIDRKKMYLTSLMMFLLGIATIFIGAFMRSMIVIALAIVILIFCIIFLVKNNRCPYCHGYLDRTPIEGYCPHCGEFLTGDEKVKRWPI